MYSVTYIHLCSQLLTTPYLVYKRLFIKVQEKWFNFHNKFATKAYELKFLICRPKCYRIKNPPVIVKFVLWQLLKSKFWVSLHSQGLHFIALVLKYCRYNHTLNIPAFSHTSKTTQKTAVESEKYIDLEISCYTILIYCSHNNFTGHSSVKYCIHMQKNYFYIDLQMFLNFTLLH